MAKIPLEGEYSGIPKIQVDHEGVAYVAAGLEFVRPLVSGDEIGNIPDKARQPVRVRGIKRGDPHITVTREGEYRVTIPLPLEMMPAIQAEIDDTLKKLYNV